MGKKPSRGSPCLAMIMKTAQQLLRNPIPLVPCLSVSPFRTTAPPSKDRLRETVIRPLRERAIKEPLLGMTYIYLTYKPRRLIIALRDPGCNTTRERGNGPITAQLWARPYASGTRHLCLVLLSSLPPDRPVPISGWSANRETSVTPQGDRGAPRQLKPRSY